MKPINSKSLDDVRVGFTSLYDGAYGKVQASWDKVAMKTNSTKGSEKYGWLGDIPGMRKWIGDRVLNNLKDYGFAIVNDDYELTVSVDRNAIEDDELGVYAPLVGMMGDSAARLPDELVYALLKGGFTAPCYDGQFFFDTDHPVLDAKGVEQSQSNHMGGAGAAWFLLDTSRPIRPLIFQERRKPNFVALDDPKDHNVFMKKKFIYGTDGRCAAGYGLWQLATASKQTLDAAGFKAARDNLQGRKGDYDRPLALKGNLLVVGQSNEKAALDVIKAERNSAGATNVYQGLSEVLVSPYLD